ncbi:MAG: hypothetical protein KDA68_00975 [Planctomycetaceae bacterium]|nr:hypothetical protein [Planctomycetaceae bacterium]
MYDQQQHQSGSDCSFQESVNLTYLVTWILSTTLTVFTRIRFGSEALGINSVGACLILLLTASFSNDAAMGWMWLLWCGLQLSHRWRTFLEWRRGIRRHSRYGGEPGMAMLFIKDEQAAKWLEPFLCAGIGLLLAPVSVVLTQFILVASGALLIRTSMEAMALRAELRNLRDAEIENRNRAAWFRRDRGDADY